jgi:hypothetical protein
MIFKILEFFVFNDFLLQMAINFLTNDIKLIPLSQKRFKRQYLNFHGLLVNITNFTKQILLFLKAVSTEYRLLAVVTN